MCQIGIYASGGLSSLLPSESILTEDRFRARKKISEENERKLDELVDKYLMRRPVDSYVKLRQWGKMENSGKIYEVSINNNECNMDDAEQINIVNLEGDQTYNEYNRTRFNDSTKETQYNGVGLKFKKDNKYVEGPTNIGIISTGTYKKVVYRAS